MSSISSPPAGRVAGKVALVTGGFSGIGLAIAQLLGAQGARVVLAGRDVAAGQKALTLISAPARCVVLDVTDEQGWREAIDDVLRVEGRLDILVNNAGIGNQSGSTFPDETSLEEWREMTRVNGEGVFLGCKHAIGAMRRNPGGSVVNIASVAALRPSPPIAAYGFTKAGVAQFTESVALYCAQKGWKIRCNAIHPGMIQTRMLDGLFDKLGSQLGVASADVRKQFLGRIPLGEFGDPLDIAQAVLFLASDEAKYVTGTQLVVDGGMVLN